MSNALKRNILIWVLVLATTLPFFYLLNDLPTLPDNELFSDIFFDLFLFKLGAIMGYIGAVLLFWEFILGTRPVANIISSDILTLNGVHQKIGIVGIFFLLAHPIMQIFAVDGSLTYLAQIDFSTDYARHVTAGRFALLLFLIIWLTSAVARGSIRYRPWKYIHYLSYPLMLAMLFHIRDIGSNLLIYPFLGALWYVAVLGFFILVVLRLLQTLWITTKQYRLTEKTLSTPDMYTYTFEPVGSAIIPEIGQYVYIQTKRWGESHPFSIMRHNKENGTLSFGIKQVGNYSKHLTDLEVGQTVSLEGPYGVFTEEGHNTNPKIIIAGGAGITPFIDLIKNFGENTILIYCNKTVKDALGRSELKSQLGNRYYEFITREKGDDTENISHRRITPEDIANIVKGSELKNPNYFICGSPVFLESIEQMLKTNNIPQKKIFAEKFSI